MFEYVSLIGSIHPTFEFVEGTQTMFPVGMSTPPKNPDAAMIFDAPFVTGLNTTTFDKVDGTHTTVPFGARTPPANWPSMLKEFENTRFT
jgi:hypothetical protein